MTFLKYIMLLLITAALSFPARAQQPEALFRDWDQLKNETPGWFRDAKFGIYFHWGVYTVPAYNSEWYSRGLYIPGSKSNKYHTAVFGSPDTFGYKDFIPMFKAENFDPDEWAGLFLQAGAKFAGPVAEHADGFSMWGSRVNPWNAKAMGLGRDVVGEMEKAIRERGLRFITTFHHQWLWGWYPTFNKAVDAGNPEYAGLYGPVVSEAAWMHADTAAKPGDDFCRSWLAKVREVVGKYRPDLVYFDSRLGHIKEKYRKELVAFYLDQTREWGRQGVILSKHHDLPEQVSVRNHEKTRADKLEENVWQTEEPISTYSWGYTRDMEIRPARDILHGLIDVVSKNGIYLLNISPRADGTIPPDQKKVLLEIGNWLQHYGEAIYGTRPWYTYGEGSPEEAEEKEREYFELKYSADDIRYTTKGKTIYAILMGRPAGNERILLRSFAKKSLPKKIHITNITLLGSNEKVTWKHSVKGLFIHIPSQIPGAMTIVFRIETNP